MALENSLSLELAFHPALVSDREVDRSEAEIGSSWASRVPY